MANTTEPPTRSLVALKLLVPVTTPAPMSSKEVLFFSERLAGRDARGAGRQPPPGAAARGREPAVARGGGRGDRAPWARARVWAVVLAVVPPPRSRLPRASVAPPCRGRVSLSHDSLGPSRASKGSLAIQLLRRPAAGSRSAGRTAAARGRVRKRGSDAVRRPASPVAPAAVSPQRSPAVLAPNFPVSAGNG